MGRRAIVQQRRAGRAKRAFVPRAGAPGRQTMPSPRSRSTMRA